MNWKRLPAIVLLAGGTIAVGWLAVRTTSVDALVRRNPYAAASLAPGDPRIPTTLAMTEFRQKQGAVTPALSARAINSLQDAPLAEEPFFLAALAALVRGDDAQAEALLLEAKKRNPRSRATRLLLLDRHLRQGQVKAAAAEISGISRLMPAARNVLVPELARFAANPRSSAALADILSSDAELKRSLLEHMASKGADPEAVLRLAGDEVRAARDGKAPEWQQQLLASLVEKGEIGRARSLWTGFAGASPGTGTIYDRQFERLPGPAPFNWQFMSNPAGVAEPTDRRSLQVEYYGRADAELANQLLTLPAGSYQLGFRASGDAPERGSSVSWRLVCHPSKVEIASVPIGKIAAAPQPFAARFIVPPSGCAGQWMKLVGTASEFPASNSVTISDLQLRKAGGV